MLCRVTSGMTTEVVAELGVYLIERRLDRVEKWFEHLPSTALDGDGIALCKDERLSPQDIDVCIEDLCLPVLKPDVTDEQLIVSHCHSGRRSSRSLRCLSDHDLEGLITSEEDLLRVAVGARIGELALKPEKDTDPPLIARCGDLCGQPCEIGRATDGAIGANEYALSKPIVSSRGSRQIDREIRNGLMLRRNRATDDAEDTNVGGKIAVSALKQIKGEVEFSLRNSLSKVEIQTICQRFPPYRRVSG